MNELSGLIRFNEKINFLIHVERAKKNYLIIRQ